MSDDPVPIETPPIPRRPVSKRVGGKMPGSYARLKMGLLRARASERGLVTGGRYVPGEGEVLPPDPGPVPEGILPEAPPTILPSPDAPPPVYDPSLAHDGAREAAAFVAEAFAKGAIERTAPPLNDLVDKAPAREREMERRKAIGGAVREALQAAADHQASLPAETAHLASMEALAADLMRIVEAHRRDVSEPLPLTDAEIVARRVLDEAMGIKGPTGVSVPPPTPTPTPTPAPAIDPATDPMGAFVDRYWDDPVGFVRNVLEAEPTPDQEDLLYAVARGDRRISIRAGHGVGKSTGCSWVMLWHMLTRSPQKTVCTAPTAGQLFDALFAELKRWINKLPDYLRSQLEVFSDRVTLAGSPESSFISARTSSADKPEALAGIHSRHVLLICDEASAIPEAVYESAAGSMSGHAAITILIGNPTRNSGLFFRTHHDLAPEWTTLHWSSLNNPFVSRKFVDQIAATYGEESNAYRVRVLGEFALRDDDVLIPAELVDAAMSRDMVPDPAAPMIYGLDVARFGDDRSVLCKRQGDYILGFKTWRNLDLMSLTGAVVNELDGDGVHPKGTTKTHEILVDSIGLGAGVADRLREQGFNVRDVNVAESAALNPKANRLRDDLWMACRDWLRARACKLPPDAELRQELVSPTYKFTSNGKLQVEAKSEMKKRGLKSPDMADALCLTFASTAAAIGGRASTWVRGQALRRNIKGVR